MNFARGQILTLEQIKEGTEASVLVRLADADLHIGDPMDLWLFPIKSDAVKFECFIVGFTIFAGAAPSPLIAVQMADSPFYVVVETGAGTICQPGQITQEFANELGRAYWAGHGVGFKEITDTAERNSNYSHTRAPQQTPAAKPARPNHLSVVRSAPKEEPESSGSGE